MIPDADGRSPVLGDYPVEGLLPEYFVGGVTEEGLVDLLPIAVLLIDHLGDRLDGIVAVHEPERLDALFGETVATTRPMPLPAPVITVTCRLALLCSLRICLWFPE